ncbi:MULTISPECIES: RICIN domain-containing protein [Agrobacterium]|uniref:RICIN domain-containing protein n=1 Tax=Agrobacterium burrii TaxID=2815339 RepID=A0ABS3EIM0_9HYPH|nr:MULTISPECIES: MAC/perforin domain-containing protein [Agrobacterium]MBO0131799.1 RICIN domain-containing protein [Agrobacterium burrii]MQB11978.1 hypothetical protein [Agrobacterium sp. ICMP 6402]
MPGPQPAEPDEDEIEQKYEALNQRTRIHCLQEAELEVTEAERQLKVRAAQVQKEAADDRAAILSAVRTSTPDITSKLVEKMDEMSIANHEFTARDKTTLMNLANLQINDSQDFFDLTPAQREDLLDRVGFYRGVAIDQRASNQVQVGFRDVLRRPGAEALSAQPANIVVAKPLYRKPAFAGYFENYFAFSEEVHQNQKNGVTNLKFSLAVSAGVAVRGGLGVAVSSSRQSQEGAGGLQKQVFITSNFFLPRIELSFDDRKPCASQEFIDACREVMDDYQTIEGRFSALRKVLDAFGHFAPTMILVGGRLFATETRTYEGAQTTSDVTKRFAASVKANLKTVSANVEASVEGEDSSQDQASENSRKENQSATFHAMGGEGGLVQYAGGWIRSLSDYRRWSVVQREDLVPSINLLPTDLRDACWSILGEFAARSTKRDLLYRENAAFIFYGEYGDRLGNLAAETWFLAENAAHLCGLTISQVPPTDGGSIGLVEIIPSDTQAWRMSPEGHLIAFVTRPAGLKGRGATAEFAISIGEAEAGSKQAELPVLLKQVGMAEHQQWAYSGAGTFTSTTMKGNYVLAVNQAKRLVARPQAKSANTTEIWNLTEITPSLDLKTFAQLPSTKPDGLFKLGSRDNKMVLSVQDAECVSKIAPDIGSRVVMLPDLGGAHQVWTMGGDGVITSRIKAVDGDVESELLLTADSNGQLCARTRTASERQRWALTSEGYLKPITETSKVATSGTANNMHGQSYPVSLEEQADTDRQRWSAVMTADAGRSFTQDFPQETSVFPYSIYSFCSLPIPVRGKVRGLRFKAYNRGRTRDGWGLKCELYVQRTGSSTCQWVYEEREPDEADPEQSAYIWSDKAQGKCFIQNSLLYLPSHPISEMRFAFVPGTTILSPMYRYDGHAEWIAPMSSRSDTLRDADQLVVAQKGVIADAAKDVIGIGFYREEKVNFLAPRILLADRIPSDR